MLAKNVYSRLFIGIEEKEVIFLIDRRKLNVSRF